MITIAQAEALKVAVESAGEVVKNGSEALAILFALAVGSGIWVYFVVVPDRKAARDERKLRAKAEADEKLRADEITLLQAQAISELSTATVETRDHALAARSNTNTLIDIGLVAAKAFKKIGEQVEGIDISEETAKMEAIFEVSKRAATDSLRE